MSDLALGDLIHVSGIEAGLKGKKDNYDAYAKGILDIKEDLIPGAVINAKGIGVNFSRDFSGTVSKSIFKERLGIRVQRSALPVRSP